MYKQWVLNLPLASRFAENLLLISGRKNNYVSPNRPAKKILVLIENMFFRPQVVIDAFF